MIDLRGLSTADKLEALQEQYDSAVFGIKPKMIIQENGERVDFTNVNIEEAKKRLNELRAKLTMSNNVGPAIVGGW
ncbi:MAG: hypothetical protein K6L81_01910 [Agarilytica sp.]